VFEDTEDWDTRLIQPAEAKGFSEFCSIVGSKLISSSGFGPFVGHFHATMSDIPFIR
jgi:hypothetical protein